MEMFSTCIVLSTLLANSDIQPTVYVISCSLDLVTPPLLLGPFLSCYGSAGCTMMERDTVENDEISSLSGADLSSVRLGPARILAGSFTKLIDIEKDGTGSVVRVGIRPDADGLLRLHVLRKGKND